MLLPHVFFTMLFVDFMLPFSLIRHSAAAILLAAHAAAAMARFERLILRFAAAATLLRYAAAATHVSAATRCHDYFAFADMPCFRFSLLILCYVVTRRHHNAQRVVIRQKHLP